MSYTDPLLHERLYYMSSGSFDAVCKKKISQPVLTGLINNVLGIIFWACLFRSKNCHWCPPKKCDKLCSDPKGPKCQKDAKCQVSWTCNGAGCFESKLISLLNLIIDESRINNPFVVNNGTIQYIHSHHSNTAHQFLFWVKTTNNP